MTTRPNKTGAGSGGKALLSSIGHPGRAVP
jgi:hypothetical protein